MNQPDALKTEAERARRIADASHNMGLIKTLRDYAEELEQRIEQLRMVPNR